MKKDILMQNLVDKYPLPAKIKTTKDRKNKLSVECINAFWRTNYRSTCCRKRYLSGALRFVEFLAKTNKKALYFNQMQTVDVENYIKKMNAESKKKSYIVTEIAAVIYYANLKNINNPKFKKGPTKITEEVLGCTQKTQMEK